MRASTYGCAGAGAHGPRRREPLHKIAPHHLKQVSLKKGGEEEEETAADALVSRGAEGEDEVEVAELLVHHEGEDAHHRRAAVVELDRALRELLLVGIVVPELEAVADVPPGTRGCRCSRGPCGSPRRRAPRSASRGSQPGGR